jgi:hypothetical protein
MTSKGNKILLFEDDEENEEENNKIYNEVMNNSYNYNNNSLLSNSLLSSVDENFIIEDTTSSIEIDNDLITDLEIPEYTMDYVLNNYIEIFNKFCETEYSSENSIFYQDLLKYKNEKGEEEKGELCKNIYQKYISKETSTVSLNFSERNFKKLINLYETEKDVNGFIELSENLIKAILIDTFRRFIVSIMWLEFINPDLIKEQEREKEELKRKDAKKRRELEKVVFISNKNKERYKKRMSFIPNRRNTVFKSKKKY